MFSLQRDGVGRCLFCQVVRQSAPLFFRRVVAHEVGLLALGQLPSRVGVQGLSSPQLSDALKCVPLSGV